MAICGKPTKLSRKVEAVNASVCTRHTLIGNTGWMFCRVPVQTPGRFHQQPGSGSHRFREIQNHLRKGWNPKIMSATIATTMQRLSGTLGVDSWFFTKMKPRTMSLSLLSSTGKAEDGELPPQTPILRIISRDKWV